MVSAVPTTPESGNGSASNGIKIADPDIVIFEDNIPIDAMADLLFENIGGQELINIARHDIVNGQSVAYRPIKNLSKLDLKYNSSNLVAVQDSSKTFFNNFPIKLENHIADTGSGAQGASVYVNSNGDLIIDIKDLAEDESVEVEILRSGDILDDTIYTGES